MTEKTVPIFSKHTLAPAKVNLFLHVGPPADDGYHPICSLMAFADVGDVVTAHEADALSLHVHGPFARALGDDDNIQPQDGPMCAHRP